MSGNSGKTLEVTEKSKRVYYMLKGILVKVHIHSSKRILIYMHPYSETLKTDPLTDFHAHNHSNTSSLQAFLWSRGTSQRLLQDEVCQMILIFH